MELKNSSYFIVHEKDAYTLDREVEKYFAAADLVVLPYISATQSGIVQIAYGFVKPVIVTNVGDCQKWWRGFCGTNNWHFVSDVFYNLINE